MSRNCLAILDYSHSLPFGGLVRTTMRFFWLLPLVSPSNEWLLLCMVGQI